MQSLGERPARDSPRAGDPSDPPQPGRHLPVLVETPPALIADVLSKNGLEIPQALWCFYISHDSHHHHRGGLDDGHSLHLLPLGDLCRTAKGNGIRSSPGSHPWPVPVAHSARNMLRTGSHPSLTTSLSPSSPFQPPSTTSPPGGPRRFNHQAPPRLDPMAQHTLASSPGWREQNAACPGVWLQTQGHPTK